MQPKASKREKIIKIIAEFNDTENRGKNQLKQKFIL